MVGIGLLMALTGLLALILRIRGRLFSSTWFHRFAIVMGPTGFIAVIAGWITTEVGRQPYLVYGLLRVSEGRSPIDAPALAGSLLSFVIVYCVVFGAGILYLVRLMQKAPVATDTGIDPHQPHRASRGPAHASAEAT